MTDLNPEIPFDGPAELKPAWEKFTAEYTKGKPYNVSSAALLNQLAFGGGVEAVLRDHGKDFRDSKAKIEDCALQLSAKTYGKTIEPALANAVAAAVVSQWIELERKHGLYPPPRDMRKKTAAEKLVIERNRLSLRNSAKGSMVVGTLEMLTNNLCNSHMENTKNRFDSVDSDLIRKKISQIFSETLFHFDPSHGVAFGNYLNYKLSSELASDMVPNRRIFLESEIKPKKCKTEFDSEVGFEPEDSLLVHLSTSGDDTTLQSVIGNEQRNIAQETWGKLWAALTPVQRKVVAKRYGLDGGNEQTMASIARESGVTESAVIHAHSLALQKARGLPLPPPEDFELGNTPRRHVLGIRSFPKPEREK